MTILKGTVPSLPTRLRRNWRCEECQEAADRIEQLEALLRHARCPNKDCIDGAYPFGPDGELCECEWCDERKALLAEDRG